MIRASFDGGPGPGLDAEALRDAYAWPEAPWVRANFAVTADGAVEVGGRSGGIGGPDDRLVFSTIREGADAILVGSGTVRAEGYGAVHIDGAGQARRGARGQAPVVPVAVVTSRADLAPDAKLFQESGQPGQARALVLTCAAAPEGARRALGEVADVVLCGDSSVDDGLVVAELAARGLGRILCEGGPTVLGRMAGAGLIDELCLTTGPLLAGPGHAGLLGRDGWPEAVTLALAGLLVSDTGAVFARYRLGGAQEAAAR